MFLLVVGLAEYAVALAAVVALLDFIPMIGATLGAVVVSAIGFATDLKIGIACVIFFLIYQQVENYVLYPRVMQRSVNVPGSVTVIAALVGAGLLGVVGALLAIPTAAAVLLLVREVWTPRQAGPLTRPLRVGVSSAASRRLAAGRVGASCRTLSTRPGRRPR